MKQTFDKMPPEQHRALSKKGGKASGKIRLQKAEKRKKQREEFIEFCIAEGLIEELERFREWEEIQKHKRKSGTWGRTKAEHDALIANARPFEPHELRPLKLYDLDGNLTNPEDFPDEIL